MQGWMYYTFYSLLCYGVWAFLPKLGTAHANSKSLILFNLCGAIFINLIIFQTVKDKVQWTPKGFMYGAITGAAGIIGTFFLIKAMEKGNSMIVVMITALYPLIVILLSTIFLKEVVTFKQIIGMGFAVVAMILMT